MSSQKDAASKATNEDTVGLLGGGFLYDRFLLRPLGEPLGRLPIRRTVLFLALTWLPLAVLSLLSGEFRFDGATPLSFLDDLTVQIRVLLGLPALLLIEPFVRERLGIVVSYLGRSDVIGEDERPLWNQFTEKARRHRDSVISELVLAALAVGTSLWGTFGATNSTYADVLIGAWRWMDTGEPSLAGWWYALVTGPVVLFHVLRWLYRLGIWTALLYQLSRLRLRLRPAHPDLNGGLGVLSISQTSFAPFFAAISVMSAGSLTYEIFYGGHSALEYKYLVAAFVVISLLLMYGPLILFLKATHDAREAVYAEYAAAANLMFTEYESRWIAGVWKGEPSGYIDPSAMTDYSQVFDNIRRMRLVPVEPLAIAVSGVLIAVPYIPLIFTALSIQEVLQRLAKALL